MQGSGVGAVKELVRKSVMKYIYFLKRFVIFEANENLQTKYRIMTTSIEKEDKQTTIRE